MINARDMVILAFDKPVHGFLESFSVNYYEILVVSDGFVVLELVSCVG